MRSIQSLLVSTVLAVFLCLTSDARDLPGNLQIDLLFPQDEIYAPTQWFPLVFGIQGAQSLWPLPFKLQVSVLNDYEPSKSRHSWHSQTFNLDSGYIADAVERTPGELLLHVPMTNMTNNTDSAYTIQWDIIFYDRCYDGKENKTKENMIENPPKDQRNMIDNWLFSNDQHWITHRTQFATKPGGIVPDIEAALESCQDLDDITSEAMKFSKVSELTLSPCPVFEHNVKGKNCNYKPIAKKLASNISSLLLGKMNCKEGDWRTIKNECTSDAEKASNSEEEKQKDENENDAGSLVATRYSAWALGLISMFAFLTLL